MCRARALAMALVLLVCAACAAGSADANARRDGTSCAPDSPFNTAISAHPTLAPNSARLVRELVRSGPPVANLYEFGTPVFEADRTSPRTTVRCTDPELPCELAHESVPIPDNARPAPGADAAMVVVDRSTQTSYEFFRAQRQPDGSWTAASTSRVALTGDGRHGQTGAGISLLAGLIRTFEIQTGRIQHALDFASQFTCRATFVYPAVKTDGSADQPDCLPMGTRLQLDPAVDVNRLPGLSLAERAIAVALQRYGGYLRNSAATPLAIGFQSPIGEADPYPGAGLKYDYAGLSNIPWNRLRVVTVS